MLVFLLDILIAIAILGSFYKVSMGLFFLLSRFLVNLTSRVVFSTVSAIGIFGYIQTLVNCTLVFIYVPYIVLFLFWANILPIRHRILKNLRAPSIQSVFLRKVSNLKHITQKNILINKINHLKKQIEMDWIKIQLWYHTFDFFTRRNSNDELLDVLAKIDQLITTVNNQVQDTIETPNQLIEDSQQHNPDLESYLSLDSEKYSLIYFARVGSWIVKQLKNFQTSNHDIRGILSFLNRLRFRFSMTNHELSSVIRQYDHLKGCFCPKTGKLLTKPIRHPNGLIFQDSESLSILNINKYDQHTFEFITDLIDAVHNGRDISQIQPPAHLNKETDIGEHNELLTPLKLTDDQEKRLQKEHFQAEVCPITQNIMTDPVVTPSNQTFERTAIENWIDRCEAQHTPPTCPLTRVEFNCDVKNSLFQNRATYKHNKEVVNMTSEQGHTLNRLLTFFGGVGSFFS